MSALELEKNWLSLHYWLRRVVLPSSLVLIAVLFFLRTLISIPQYRDQAAALIGFFTLYFILIRGGHLLMIRSMHFDLKKTYGEKYDLRLAKLPSDLKRQNIGFLLARIKRDLIHTQK